MAKPVKKRSEQGRVAPTKKGINKIVQGRIKKGEVVQPGKLAAKAAVKGAKTVKAVKAKGLEKRGTKLSPKEKNIRDKEYIQNKRFDKAERTYDAKISQTSSGEKLKGLGKSGRKKITRENQIFAKLKQKNK
jgi:hypothetical protein